MTRSEDFSETSIALRRASPRRVVLVTGFGAFPGAPKNPTAEIIAALERHGPRLARLGITLRREMLPVRFDGADQRLGALVARHRPDIVLHLGVAGRRRRLSIETRAINRAGPLHPDASGRCPSQLVVPGAAPSLRATYPATRMLAAVAPEVGFVHVPKARAAAYPTSPVRRPRLSIDGLTKAVLVAILAMARGPTA